MSAAHGEVVISAPSGIYMYNRAVDRWIATPISGYGEAIECVIDEDTEVYRTVGPRYYGGDSRVVSYNVDYNWSSYEYGLPVHGIFDLTVQYGQPVMIALDYYAEGWYRALHTFDGEYWIVWTDLAWYSAVDCSPNGNLAASYCVTDLDQQWVKYNGVDVIDYSGQIIDIAVSDYSITP